MYYSLLQSCVGLVFQDDALVSDSKEPPPKPAKLPSISTETEVIEEKVTVSEDVEVTMDGDNGNDETIEKGQY